MNLADILNEVDSAVYAVKAAYPELAAWADERCEACREALDSNDAAAAATAAIELGQRLAEIRECAKLMRPSTSRAREREHRKALERYETFRTLERRFPESEALKRAAEKHGVSTKTIRRAQKIINPE